MHCLSIVFGAGAPVMWKLIYRTEEAAKAAYTTITHPQPPIAHEMVVECVDDFGQSTCIRLNSVAGVMLEDLEQSKMAHVEMSLHEARTRSTAQKMAQADPAIRQAAMMGAGGPAIFSPMQNGRM